MYILKSKSDTISNEFPQQPFVIKCRSETVLHRGVICPNSMFFPIIYWITKYTTENGKNRILRTIFKQFEDFDIAVDILIPDPVENSHQNV